eukprot:COSAG06_NODE_10774_length_1618_cov_2.062541_2_plen_188_part_00
MARPICGRRRCCSTKLRLHAEQLTLRYVNLLCLPVCTLKQNDNSTQPPIREGQNLPDLGKCSAFYCSSFTTSACCPAILLPGKISLATRLISNACYVCSHNPCSLYRGYCCCCRTAPYRRALQEVTALAALQLLWQGVSLPNLSRGFRLPSCNLRHPGAQDDLRQLLKRTKLFEWTLPVLCLQHGQE